MSRENDRQVVIRPRVIRPARPQDGFVKVRLEGTPRHASRMKSMGGGGGSTSVSTRKYKPPTEEKPKRVEKAASHSEMAMAWEANGRDKNGKLIKYVEKPKGWTKEDINRARDRALEEQRRAAAGPAMTDAADAGDELEPIPAGESAHVLARTRMAELALALQGLDPMAAGAGSSSEQGGGSTLSHEQLWTIAEGRRAQLVELECLQALFPDEFVLLTPADAVSALRARCEALGHDVASADAAALQEVAAHRSLEFVLQLTAYGERGQAADGEEDGEAAARPAVALVASILLRVRFPPEYPQAAPPEVSVEDSMVTTQAPLPQNKVLATLAILDEGGLVCGFLARAAECLPDPCVYEAATWLTESAFDFVGQAWIPA
jgi:hypothetical protein